MPEPVTGGLPRPVEFGTVPAARPYHFGLSPPPLSVQPISGIRKCCGNMTRPDVINLFFAVYFTQGLRTLPGNKLELGGDGTDFGVLEIGGSLSHTHTHTHTHTYLLSAFYWLYEELIEQLPYPRAVPRHCTRTEAKHNCEPD